MKKNKKYKSVDELVKDTSTEEFYNKFKIVLDEKNKTNLRILKLLDKKLSIGQIAKKLGRNNKEGIERIKQVIITCSKLYKHLIPKGDYCHNGKGTESCPYWSIRKDKPEQENGYCYYLKKGDWELYLNSKFIDTETQEITLGKDMPIPISLLWDMCKECGINGWTEEEYNKMIEEQNGQSK